MEKLMHPILAKRNQQQFKEKIQGVMKKHGVDVLIIVKPENVTYATGYRSILGYLGLMPGGAVVTSDGDVHLMVSKVEGDTVYTQISDDIEVHMLESFFFVDDGTEDSLSSQYLTKSDPHEPIRMSLSIAREYGAKTVGIEMPGLPSIVEKIIKEESGNADIIDSTGLMLEARMIKLPWEVDVMRAAAQHTSKIYYHVAQNLKPGMNALEINRLITKFVYEFDEYNATTSYGIGYCAGEHYGFVGYPLNYVLQEGDVIKLDGGVNYLGYYTDISHTFVVGDIAKPEDEELYAALMVGYKRGMDLLRPGIKMSEYYREVRNAVEGTGVIKNYARGHVGHGVGMSTLLEEFPFFSASTDLEIMPGMILTNELSYASKGLAKTHGGFNIEDMYVIIEDGHERFTYAPETLLDFKTKEFKTGQPLKYL